MTSYQARHASHVRCGGCGHNRTRGTMRAVAGVLYGPECYEKARREAYAWYCSGCQLAFPEEDMATADTCKGCSGGI